MTSYKTEKYDLLSNLVNIFKNIERLYIYSGDFELKLGVLNEKLQNNINSI